jgi:hypothetical protein
VPGLLASGVAVSLLASACTPPAGRQAAWAGEHVEVPAVPFPVATAFEVDRALLDELACAACGVPERPGDARFFYGTLALDSADALFAHQGGDRAEVRARLGNLFLSGWFGGRYLTTTVAIGLGSESAGAPTGLLPLSGAALQSALLGTLRGGTFAGLDGSVGELVRVADRGDEASVRRMAAGLVLLMSLVHGYNRGYLEVVLGHPPGGATPPAPLQCGTWLGCRSTALPLEALVELGPTATRLTGSSDPTWQLLGESMQRAGGGAVPAGREVWSRLLSTDGFDPAAYEAIVELSYGFLEVTEAAMLALAEGAVGDVRLGRRGLHLAAGLLLWSGSYLLGLTGDDTTTGPTGLPTLRCS